MTEDDRSNLQMVYEAALLQHRAQISEILTPLLTVDPKSVPEWYATIFSLPWHKCYTLNIDDLELAVAREYKLPREIIATSGLSRSASNISGNRLEVVHLNGTVSDLPDRVTFSATQYAERLASEEPIYLQLAAELLSHPFVFIGTSLDEPPLWQHIELRFSKGRKMREFRPHSYLLTPSIDKAREVYLSQFNIDWIPKTAEAFAREIVPEMADAVATGLKFLESTGDKDSVERIPQVANLAKDPHKKTEFLLGSEPIWADVQSGRAIEREFDATLAKRLVDEAAVKGTKRLFLIVGTAGSGKSTTLMRAALELSNQGKRVGWIDPDTNISPRAIRHHLGSDDSPDVVFIDDGDMYGAELSPLARDIVLSDPKPLLVLGIRSGRLEKVVNPVQLKQIVVEEFVMPHLADDDIEDLLAALDRENRLGRLKGLPLPEQISAFREQAGRQLLVAMIQATSGVKFEDKAIAELGDLSGESRSIYSLVCIATYLGFNLTRSEILVGLGNTSNETLNALEELARRHIIEVMPSTGNFRAAPRDRGNHL
jgi:SIR2-like domain